MSLRFPAKTARPVDKTAHCRCLPSPTVPYHPPLDSALPRGAGALAPHSVWGARLQRPPRRRPRREVGRGRTTFRLANGGSACGWGTLREWAYESFEVDGRVAGGHGGRGVRGARVWGPWRARTLTAPPLRARVLVAGPVRSLAVDGLTGEAYVGTYHVQYRWCGVARRASNKVDGRQQKRC